MDNKSIQLTFNFPNLYSDIQKSIIELHFIEEFNDQKFKVIFNASKVSKSWYNFIQDFSKQLLNKYFPFFQNTNHNLYSLYLTNPLQLLAKTCKNLQADFPSVNTNIMLDILNVNNTAIVIDQIKAEENNPALQKILYILAIANGHACTIDSLKNQETAINQNALLIAAKNGNLIAVEKISALSENLFLAKALKKSAKNGHVAICDYLIKTNPTALNDFEKKIALIKAEKHKQRNVIKYLLTTLSTLSITTTLNTSREGKKLILGEYAQLLAKQKKYTHLALFIKLFPMIWIKDKIKTLNILKENKGDSELIKKLENELVDEFEKNEIQYLFTPAYAEKSELKRERDEQDTNIGPLKKKPKHIGEL